MSQRSSEEAIFITGAIWRNRFGLCTKIVGNGIPCVRGCSKSRAEQAALGIISDITIPASVQSAAQFVTKALGNEGIAGLIIY